MVLKEQIKKDLDFIFNIDEFAEDHYIDLKKIRIVKDDTKLHENSKKDYDGLYVGDIMYFVKAMEYGKPPKIGELQNFDGRAYTVFDVRVEENVYEITLKINEN